MRVSTSMIYDKGLGQIQAQTASLLKTQQQLASGKRILTPSDDPIAAARALEVGQSREVNQQFLTNQSTAYDRLGVVESRLVGVGDILQYARERAVQAGNAALGPQEKGYIATDMREQFSALVALANTKDAQGDYVFSGYKTDNQPYVGGFGQLTYQGDNNQRGVQVSATRTMPVSFSGTDVFGSGRAVDPVVDSVSAKVPVSTPFTVTRAPGSDDPDPGVSYIVEFDGTNYNVTRREAGAADAAQGPVTFDPAARTLSFSDGSQNIALRLDGQLNVAGSADYFAGDADDAPFSMTLSATSPQQPDSGIRYIVTYDLDAPDSERFTVIRREPGLDDVVMSDVAYDPAGPTLSFDGGVTFDVAGVPRNGDAAEVFVSSDDMFQNFALFIDALERPGPTETADGATAFALRTFDTGLESLSRVRAKIGSQMVEIDNLRSVSGDLEVQYASELSRLQDLDYAEAISRLSRQQVFLEAAQQSYLRVTGLSLFNFLS